MNFCNTPAAHKYPNCVKSQPYFAQLHANIIEKFFEKTIEKTTQHARISLSPLLKQNHESIFLALIINCRYEVAAVESVYYGAPIINNGSVAM